MRAAITMSHAMTSDALSFFVAQSWRLAKWPSLMLPSVLPFTVTASAWSSVMACGSVMIAESRRGSSPDVSCANASRVPDALRNARVGSDAGNSVNEPSPMSSPSAIAPDTSGDSRAYRRSDFSTVLPHIGSGSLCQGDDMLGRPSYDRFLACLSRCSMMRSRGHSSHTLIPLGRMIMAAMCVTLLPSCLGETRGR